MSSVRYETDGPVAVVTIDRPAVRNAVDRPTSEALADAFRRFDGDDALAAAVLTGAGGTFCAGADLKGVSQGRGNAVRDEGDGPMGPTRMLLAKPVIAAVAGPAVAGGFELALWCDLRVMEESAYFGVYCRRWGVPLIDGGTVRLPRLVGTGRALEIILTGRKVPAEEALRIGACEHIVPDGSSREFAEAMAHEIARFPQACTRADRRSVYAQQGLSIREGMRREWYNGIPAFVAEGAEGAKRFAQGKGRHGDFRDI